MHEAAVMRDLMRAIETVAQAEGAARVTAIHVRLGDLSHMTPDHFREHFEDASRGTLAEGARIEVVETDDPEERQAVRLESVEVELAEPADA
jgi:hydrogenase nickel incorporation protein HypA/HybF